MDNASLTNAALAVETEFRSQMSIFSASRNPDAITHCPIKVKLLNALSVALRESKPPPVGGTPESGNPEAGSCRSESAPADTPAHTDPEDRPS